MLPQPYRIREGEGVRICILLWITSIIAVLALFFAFIAYLLAPYSGEHNYFLIPGGLLLVFSLLACAVFFRDSPPAPPLGPPQQAPPAPPAPPAPQQPDDDFEIMIGDSFPDDRRGAGGLRF